MNKSASVGTIRAVLLDIEGTLVPIRFVHETMFGYARAALDRFLASKDAASADVQSALAAIRHERPGMNDAEAVRALIDADAKFGPLKWLQGRIWTDGFRSGALRSEFYPDVAPALRRWVAGGVRAAIYSSGSVQAQRLLFAHGASGDLTVLFTGFFDTAVGGKRDAASYRAIAAQLQFAPSAILFLSDIGAELDAAATAGLLTCQIIRPQDGTIPAAAHRQAADLAQISAQFGLPA
ncbi:MAG TPA: acireductone synthase [Acidiphilium sp.]|nr:MAG: acireductone synthase [Acidiphilium sp. 21-60-14]OYV92010.1 MAG: acireductone synthase [Acidiphilium sp. 37-60-79]OZB39322.1 MAG: acireductone synthase [Acidiphilium sp. 34-60-192]HQT89169.1 acireductone synthase [Acidiphilium sp.]HQU24190.1 acireductone synthase [Acidiphilium sp.]